jgi:hypothetical protein
LSPQQIEIYQKMLPEKKLAIAEQLYWTARELKGCGLKQQHPDWSEEQVAQEVRRIFLYART